MIRRLAEDDKDGDMAEKVKFDIFFSRLESDLLLCSQVLKLFWSLAHSSDVTTDIMDQVRISVNFYFSNYSFFPSRHLLPM